MVFEPRGAGQFDIPYGLASAAFTTGKTVVATTQAAYHGVAMTAGTTNCSIVIYDNASDTSGNVVDIIGVTATGNAWIDRYIPVIAKNGLTIKATGSGLDGTVFYGPKG